MDRQKPSLVLLGAFASVAEVAACGARAPAGPAPAPHATALALAAPSPGDGLPLDDPGRCEDSGDIDESAPAEAASVELAAGRGAREALDADTIRAVVRRNFAGFMGCYELGLGRHPTLRGRVTTRFAIAPGGKISQMLIAANELPDCTMVDCIRDHFVTIEFPPPGSLVTVQYPLVFEPGAAR